jgi:hypothetical protein
MIRFDMPPHADSSLDADIEVHAAAGSSETRVSKETPGNGMKKQGVGC